MAFSICGQSFVSTNSAMAASRSRGRVEGVRPGRKRSSWVVSQLSLISDFFLLSGTGT